MNDSVLTALRDGCTTRALTELRGITNLDERLHFVVRMVLFMTGDPTDQRLTGLAARATRFDVLRVLRGDGRVLRAAVAHGERQHHQLLQTVLDAFPEDETDVWAGLQLESEVLPPLSPARVRP